MPGWKWKSYCLLWFLKGKKKKLHVKMLLHRSESKIGNDEWFVLGKMHIETNVVYYNVCLLKLVRFLSKVCFIFFFKCHYVVSKNCLWLWDIELVAAGRTIVFSRVHFMNYNCFMVNENTQWHNTMPFPES